MKMSTDLRLMGGRNDSQGIVEIRYLGIWGTICNDGWDMKDAQVVCRQLGYYKAASLILEYSAIPSNGTEPLITKLECTGNEPSIGLCNKQVLLAVSHHCDHTKDAQVVCAHPSKDKQLARAHFVRESRHGHGTPQTRQQTINIRISYTKKYFVPGILLNAINYLPLLHNVLVNFVKRKK